jgi:hypothetical protein
MLGLEEQERRTREARLLVSRPEEVFKELRSYGAQAKAVFGCSDEQLEKSLLERGDPLIDLGLACYGSDKGAVGGLYKKALSAPNTPAEARYRKGLRIACLSNQVLHKMLSGEYSPREIIGEDETHRVLNEADLDEAYALICNPEIECELLQALYERTGPFSTIPDDRWRGLVSVSAKNTRLTDCRDDEEGPDLGFMHVQAAILKLLAPVTRQWLHALYRLLDGLDALHVARPDKIDHVLERWSAVTDYKPDEGYFTSLKMKDEFRCLIAALYGKTYANNKTVVLGTATAPDVALRCAFYGNAQLTSKEIHKGRERDADAFEFAVLFNDHVYLKPELRKLLEEEVLTGNFRARYLRRCEQLHKRWRYFDPRPMADWLAIEGATETEQSSLSKLSAWASASDTKMANLANHIQSAKKWMAWGFIILAALVLLRK